MNIENYWHDIIHQHAHKISSYFDSTANIYWHNTNECFNVEEFIIANCEYPNEWDMELKSINRLDCKYICVAHVFAINTPLSFHVTSFIEENEVGLITRIDEYWGEDGLAPEWRLAKQIGKPIR